MVLTGKLQVILCDNFEHFQMNLSASRFGTVLQGSAAPHYMKGYKKKSNKEEGGIEERAKEE